MASSDLSGPAAERPGGVRLTGVSHRYGRGEEAVTAVGPLDLTVPPGEFLVLPPARSPPRTRSSSSTSPSPPWTR
ncbi:MULTISPECIES: hypothetical protein [Streptomyces]|uniref:hypothetical protein n=1 Tax=Streptomyces TaxID=1883 RepID=UPI0026885728